MGAERVRLTAILAGVTPVTRWRGSLRDYPVPEGYSAERALLLRVQRYRGPRQATISEMQAPTVLRAIAQTEQTHDGWRLSGCSSDCLYQRLDLHLAACCEPAIA